MTSPPDDTIDPHWLEHVRWVYDVSRRVAETLQTARPSKFRAFNTAVYREYWDQKTAGTFGAHIEHSFVQEPVGSGGAEGVIAAIDSQTQDRMRDIRRGLRLLGPGLGLCSHGTLARIRRQRCS